MCGIAGIVHTDARAADPAALRRMADAMAHRGPDGSGVWADGPAGLAHRRLAIIDLAGGRQPMVSPFTGCVLTFNGEIYNYRELREQLRSDGSRFLEQSDTEVVLRAYERWGDACVDRLRGMFAFAVWDPRARRLFAARDRVGIKPFYYRWHDGTLTFASELKAILAADPARRPGLDPRSFDRYLRLQYVPAPHTMVDGVRQLRPAHALSLSAESGAPVEQRYWEPRSGPVSGTTAGDFQERLSAVVRSHMVADVPVGALLSGGVDSSLVVAHMVVAASSGPVHTFSVGFEDDRLDERASARRVSAHLGTIHHEQVVTDADAADALPRIVAAMDEPLADYAALPTYLIARFAAQHVKVVLTGEGADELFAGYRRYRRDRLLAPFVRLRPPYQASHVFSGRETARLLGRRPSRLAATRGSGRAADPLNELLLRDIEGWLPDNLLVKVDRMTMLCSLEARVPYLDHGFVEYALGIPAAHKLRLLRGTNKVLMRQAAATMIPERIAARPKQGFKPPIDAWLRGRLRPLAHDALLSADASLRSHVDLPSVRRLLAEHDAGRTNGHRIWALLVHELWSREHRVP